MKRIKNQKGFTLVELLVAVVILGIITGMSIPLIRNVRLNNEQRKYNSYGDSLISATKLYVDSYGQDLFGYKKTGCALISYQQLKNKGLIKDFSDKNMSCNSDDTLVRVVKMNKQYGYSYQLYCGPAGADGKATSAEFKSSSTSKKVNEVIKKQNDDSDKDDDNDGFSDTACNLVTSMDIQINPESNTTKAESHSLKVTLMSSTGINPGSSIQYAWVDVDSKDTISEIDYNAITDWKTANFNVDSHDSQMQQILSATDSIVLSKPKTIQTPSSAPAYYVLVLKIDNFRDLEGEQWKNKDDETNPYKLAGIYNVGKKFTITYDNNGGNGCTSSSVLKEKNTNTKWGDNNSLCTPTRDKYVFTGWNTSQDGTGTTITNDTIVENDLTVYAQWKQSKVHFRIKLQAGETITATTTGTDGTVYKWAKDSNNYLTTSVNNGAAAIYDYSVNRGENINVNLPNYNYNKYINITKTGHYTDSGKEWICESGCKTAGQTFSHDAITINNTEDICDPFNPECIITLHVNWKMNKPTTPTITNNNANKWVASNYNITIATTTSESIIGDWYYKINSNGTYTKYSQTGKKSFESTMSTSSGTLRNNTLYVIVCNKAATGPNDSNNCSAAASSVIKIDKEKPVVKGYNSHAMNTGGMYGTVMISSQCPGNTRKTGHCDSAYKVTCRRGPSTCNWNFDFEYECTDGSGSGCVANSEQIKWDHNGFASKKCLNWTTFSSCGLRLGNTRATWTKLYIRMKDNVGNYSEDFYFYQTCQWCNDVPSVCN